MERRITLNDKTMKKKNEINNFENVSNEKQNSLTSGIRIGLNGDFPAIKQKDSSLEEIIRFVTEENGFVGRITVSYMELRESKQISIF